MTSRFKAQNPVKSEVTASKILEDLRCEIAQKRGVVIDIRSWNGLNRRYRNRLLSEAGYSYDEAYEAVASIQYRRGGGE